MKQALIAAIMVASAAGFTPRCRAEQRPTYVREASYLQCPLVFLTEFPDQEKSSRDNQATQDHAPAGNTTAQWILIVITGITAGFICWQAWETRRAANATKKAAEGVERQVGIMESQKEALEKSVIAAEDNASAAKSGSEASNKNVEMFISKERARLRVDLKPFSVADKITNAYLVNFSISIYGTTSAFISDSGATAYFLPKDAIDVEDVGKAVMFPVYNVPKTIAPSSPPIETYAFLFIDDPLILPEIEKGGLVIGIRGFVAYGDVFDRPRETRFRYAWSLEEESLLGLGLIRPLSDGKWVKSGPPGDNKET